MNKDLTIKDKIIIVYNNIKILYNNIIFIKSKSIKTVYPY